MRRLLFLLPFAVAGCPRSSKPAPVDAATPVALVSAVASSSASASASASAEGPPALPTVESAPIVKLPPRTDVPATAEIGKPVVLQGVFVSDRGPDAQACDAVRLDKPIDVHDDKGEIATDGRGLGDHPTIGHAKRICVWSWNGWKQSNDGWMIPSGSHVVMRGSLWTPMVGHHPRALLLFDTELLSATPPATPVPAGKLPNGDTVAYVRKVDGENELQLDIAFLYYGAAARKLAADRGETLPAGQLWYFVNESTQLRPWKLQPLAPGVEWPMRLTPSSSGGFGWRTIDKSELAGDKPYLITVEKGALKSFREITLEVN